jgi:large subunit ribosomal protein L22
MAETKTPETMARLRHHRASPTKVRQVLRLIVGKDVADARETLRFCERGPAETVMKLLDSAVANAEHNDNIPEEELFVTRAFADEGPTAKRWRPRARGRGTRIRKRTSHITLVVARYEDDALEQRRQREATDTQAQRASRRRRVAGSQRKAEREAAREAEHDHDHDDHDHEHDDELVDEVETAEVEADEVEADEVEADEVETDEVDAEIEAAETDDAPEAATEEPADEEPGDDETAEKPEGSK